MSYRMKKLKATILDRPIKFVHELSQFSSSNQAGEALSHTSYCVHLQGIGISLIDDQPVRLAQSVQTVGAQPVGADQSGKLEEIAYAYIGGVDFRMITEGPGLAIEEESFCFRIHHIQFDNCIPNCLFRVLLAPQKHLRYHCMMMSILIIPNCIFRKGRPCTRAYTPQGP